MNSMLVALRSQLQSRLSSELSPEILDLVETCVGGIVKEVMRSVTSIEMLLFQRDYSEAVVKLDELKCNCSNLQVPHKKGYDQAAQKQIKRSFQKQTSSFLSQQLLSGIMSYEVIKPRLSSRQKLGLSTKKRRQVHNGEDSSSKHNLQNRKTKTQTHESVKKGKTIKERNPIDSSQLRLRIPTKDRKDNLAVFNRTLNMPSTTKRKVFK